MSTATHGVLIRGITVDGKNPVAMPRLCVARTPSRLR